MGADTVRRLKPQPKSVSSGGSTIFNFLGRLLAWYTLYTVLFRCPSNPTQDAPTICHTSHAIKTSLQPHVQPYYETYLSPYVEQYSPYVQHANKVYLTPAYNSASASYRKYAEPHVVRGQKYAQQEYTRILKPKIDESAVKANGYYTTYLAPHVASGVQNYESMKPTMYKYMGTVEGFYNKRIFPAYKTCLPYMQKAYEQAKYVILVIVAPIVKDGGEKAVGWGSGVWHDIIGPQVERIGERLSGTSNGNGVPAASVSSSIFSSLSATDASKEAASTSSLSSMISSASSASSAAASVASDETGSKKYTKEEVREIIEQDLATWTEKFGDAANKAIANLNSEIDDICHSAKNQKSKHVASEIASLVSSVETGFDDLKKTVIKLAKPLSIDSPEEDKQKAHEKLSSASRKFGIVIRDKAQAIRKESEEFLSSVYDEVAGAADSHLDVLDSVSDVGLQELGMRWAWIDHVTYKDWQRYHELKKSFADTRTTVISAAQRNAKLIELTDWAHNEWEGKATAIAKDAAEELKRLKAAGKQKIELGDDSDDFSGSVVPVAAKKAAQQVMDGAEKMQKAAGNVGGDVKEKAEDLADKASEAVYGTPQPASESIISVASEAVEDATSKLSEKVYGTELGVVEKAATAVSEVVVGTDEPMLSSVSSAASEAAETAKSKVPGGVYAGFVAAAEIIYEDDEETIASQLSSRLAEASKAVSEALIGTTTSQDSIEKATSIASEQYESAISAASSMLYGTPKEGMVGIATDKYSAAVAAASSVIYGTPTPQPELLMSKASAQLASATGAASDLYQSANRKIATMVKPEEKPAKESLYSEAQKSYDQALTAATSSYSAFLAGATGAREQFDSAVSRASEQLRSVASSASTAVYGEPKPASESILSVAQMKYSSALKEAENSYNAWYNAASAGVFGTPTPAAESFASAVSEKIYGTDEGYRGSATSLAAAATDSVEERYLALQALVSELVIGKEPTFTESVMSRFSNAVYGTEPGFVAKATSAAGDAYDAASSRIQQNLNGAGEMAYDASLRAAENLSSASSMASEQFESVTSAAGAMMTPPPIINDIIASASSQIVAAIDAASTQVYGTKQGTFESITSAAAEGVNSAAADASSWASEQIYGKDLSAPEKAWKQVEKIRDDAYEQLSVAIYGTPTGTIEAAKSTVVDAANKAGEAVADAKKEYYDRTVENAQKQIENVLQLAKENLDTIGKDAGKIAEQMQSKVAEATQKIKDEL